MNDTNIATTELTSAKRCTHTARDVEYQVEWKISDSGSHIREGERLIDRVAPHRGWIKLLRSKTELTKSMALCRVFLRSAGVAWKTAPVE